MSRPGLPSHREIIRATVARSTRLGPHFLRLTLAIPAGAGFEHQGLDQLVRLFFPRPGQASLRLPTAANNGWMAQVLMMPASTRPLVRNYTVRAYRAAERELDVDFVVHGDGPAPTWALAALPGDEVGLFDEGTSYGIRAGADWQLVVADESAVPAALSVAEHTPPELPTRLLLEVPHDDDRLEVELGSHVTVDWLVRRDERLPGRLAWETAAALRRPAGRPSISIAGESGMATGLRRELVAAGVAKSDMTFVGYWRHGRGSLG